MAVGKHLVITIKNVKNIKALERVEILQPLMKNIVDKCKLTIVSEIYHQFQPQGVTFAYILSESHFTAHSYPETQSAYLDIFCCDMNFDSELAIKLIKESFDTDIVNYITLMR